MLYLFRKNQGKVSRCEEEIEKSTMSLLGGGRPAGWDVPAVATCFPDELHIVLPGLMPITTCHCRVFRTALGRSPIYRGTRCFLVCNRLRIESMPLGGEAAASSQFELPTVHCTSEHTIFYMRKARQVCLQMGTTALDEVAVAFP